MRLSNSQHSIIHNFEYAPFWLFTINQKTSERNFLFNSYQTLRSIIRHVRLLLVNSLSGPDGGG